MLKKTCKNSYHSADSSTLPFQLTSEDIDVSQKTIFISSHFPNIARG